MKWMHTCKLEIHTYKCQNVKNSIAVVNVHSPPPCKFTVTQMKSKPIKISIFFTKIRLKPICFSKKISI